MLAIKWSSLVADKQGAMLLYNDNYSDYNGPSTGNPNSLS